MHKIRTYFFNNNNQERKVQKEMKHAKRFTSFLLALVMVLAMTITVSAAQEGTLDGGSITINDAVPGQNYSIYQILYLESYSHTTSGEATGAYAYKANSAWKTFVNSSAIKGVYLNVDSQGYVTWKDGASVADFAKLAQAEAATKSVDGTATAPAAAEGSTTSKVSFSNLKLGYYLVDTTLGTLCSLDTTNPSVVMEEKNEVPTSDKKVEEDSKVGVDGVDAWGEKNDADIGQTVNFKSTLTAQAGAENYMFHDTMSAGLTYKNVTGVTLNGNTVDDSKYTVVTEGLSDGCTFEVRFTQAFCDTLKANDIIVISYSAVLNENAVIAGDGNPNECKLSYGDSSNIKTTTVSTTTTYTWKVDVYKYTMEGENEKALADATFTLSKNSDGTNPIALISLGNNVYRVAKPDESGSVTSVTTDKTGKFTINGLDSDTYYLTETAAPDGYNKLSGPVTVVVGEDGIINKTNEAPNGVDEVRILNQSGAEMPSTGGIGTPIFYVIGSILVLVAVVLLVTKKRMNK